MKETNLELVLVKAVEDRKSNIQTALIGWGRKNYRHFPWRTNRSPYSVLISELLLKRTTASAANRLFEEFIGHYPNIQKLSQAEEKELNELLSTIGYQKRRAKILLEIAEFLLKRYNGDIPKLREELLEIPYVGDYTASAILSLGYGIPSAMVDCNIIRIIKRVFLKHLPVKPSQKIIQRVADLLAPKRGNQCYNYALLDLGALVCRSGVPRCSMCPINKLCDYYLLGKTHN